MAYNNKQMTKKTNKNLYLWIVIGVVGILAVGSITLAYNSDSLRSIILESGAVMNYNESAQNVSVSEEPTEMLGSMTSPNITSRYLCVNNDCTYYLTGQLINASTTIVSIPNPFLEATSTAADVVISGIGEQKGYTGATSTLELVRLNVTGVATTTYTIQCGASAGPTTDPTLDLLTSDSISSSTYAVVENNIAAAANLGIGGGTTAKIMLSPTYPWIVCTVDTVYEGAFTETTNTFDGYYTIRVSRSIF